MMIDVKKILVPTDFSEFSDKALSEALEIAETFNSKVYLLYVIRGESGFSIMETFDEETQNKIHAQLKQKTEAAFEEQIDKFPLSEKVEIITEVVKGVPYKEILEYQKQIEPDVVVIAALGRSSFEDFFFGSTSEKIVRRAGCSVLVVK
jgi:nucleotide-binding universal stress UspA family protein